MNLLSSVKMWFWNKNVLKIGKETHDAIKTGVTTKNGFTGGIGASYDNTVP